MSSSTRLRPIGVAAALLLLGGCVPRLRQIPGSDRATHSWPKQKIIAGRRSAAGCGGQVVPVAVNGGNGTLGDRGGVCAEVTTDTVPDPNTDITQPPRKIP